MRAHYSYLNRYHRMITISLLGMYLQGCSAPFRVHIAEESPMQSSANVVQPQVFAGVTSFSTPSRSPGTSIVQKRATHAADKTLTSTAQSIAPTTSNDAMRYFPGSFISASGERVLFRETQGQWQALLQKDCINFADAPALQIVNATHTEVGTLLAFFQKQDAYITKARMHIINTGDALAQRVVYLGKIGLLGGMPETGEANLSSLSYEDLMKVLRLERSRREALEYEHQALRKTYEQELKHKEEERETLQKDYDVLRAEYAEHVMSADRREREINDRERQCEELFERLDTITARFQTSQQEYDNLLARSSTGSCKMGKDVWEKYFGEVGMEPPLPDNIDTILVSSCPFWPDKTIGETHLLAMIPATVNGSPFTLDVLGALVAAPKSGVYQTQLRYHNSLVREAIGMKSEGRSYWILMTRDVLPSSRSHEYSAQRSFVDDMARTTGIGYTIPTVLEASTAILLHYVRGRGVRLYSEEPATYTRCLDFVDGPHPVSVGGFSEAALHIHHTYRNVINDFGVACLRKF